MPKVKVLRLGVAISGGARQRLTSCLPLASIMSERKKHFPRYAAALEALEFGRRLVNTLKDGSQKHIIFFWQRLGGVIQMEAETIVVKPFPERSTPARGSEGSK